MNIFVLDLNPYKAATYYDDVRLPKMVVELYQQLGSAVIRHGATPDMMPLTKKGTPLRGGYHSHPCTRWTGDSRDNFIWASIHAATLAEEYERRFDKEHFCANGIEKLFHLRELIPCGDMTPFALAMPDEYRPDYIHVATHPFSVKTDAAGEKITHARGNLAVAAYRKYYKSKTDSKGGVRYKHTREPTWWKWH